MDISLRTTEFFVEDQSWLGSRDGTDVTQGMTLYLPSFTPAIHYPKGYIPSGIVVARITSGAGAGMHGPYAGSTSESQTVTITGGPTGGTWTLTFNGETTAGIPFNATADAVRAALAALPGINATDIAVSGGPGPATPYVVAFRGQFAGQNVAQMTASGAGLTGGTTPAVNVATTTGGGSTSASGLDVPDGFLLTSKAVKTANIGAPLHWRGVIRVSRLPAASGFDENARRVLGAKFRFED
ncbi:hypothetical protein [Micromonospora sp. RV43]|uniref:hypothetical protein n=1 Tax=Micromonospora sp. RV43 TaxID=1661387 RepID=UPI00069FE14F|nr:hypothetical protein [Micromonospora sp. RV43]